MSSSASSHTQAYSLLAVCLCAWLISIAITFTRVPIIYAFRLMACEAYYEDHPPYIGEGDRCKVEDIEVETATNVSFLGISITVNGLVNLLVTSWSLKIFSIKAVLVQQTVGPAIRLAIQLIGVRIGSRTGMLIVQVSQLLGVVGGSTGYILVTNAYVSRIVVGEGQSSALGRLQGAVMFGTALAYLGGGWVSEYYSISAAFATALGLMVCSVIFELAFLGNPRPAATSPRPQGFSPSKFLAPVRIFKPALLQLANGRVTRYHGGWVLGLSSFLGVLATGFVPILLQLYSTNELGFSVEQNGFLMAINFGVRGLFLTTLFPPIITKGRALLSQGTAKAFHSRNPRPDQDTPLLQREPSQKPSSVRFDTWFLRASFLIDGALTSAVVLCREPWHVYLAAFLLPFASGSAPAAKGIILAMCRPDQSDDALSAITLTEMLATMLSMTGFGMLFSALAAVRQSNLVFYSNAGLAIVAAMVACFSKTRPVGSQVLDEEHEEGN